MMGDIVLHEVGGIDFSESAEFIECRLKFLVGCLSGILELLEVGGLYAIHIRQDGFESTAAFVGDVMLTMGQPPHEIIHAEVVGVFDDVMDDTFVGFAALGKEDRAWFVGKSLEHETMGCFAAEMAHSRVR